MKHQDKIKKSLSLFGPREELIKVCEELDEKMKAKVKDFEKVLKEKERDIYPEPEY